MNKGFTLIELLAVIVILAVIALIATPIVLSIINDTKESAVIRSGEFYVNAVQSKIMQENMKLGGTLNPKECIVNALGNVTCDGTNLEIEVNGQKPSGGSITFNEGKITGVNLTFGDKNVSMKPNGELVLGDYQVCKLISDSDNSGTVTSGDKYLCKVKDNMETGFEEGYYFYVLSKEDDGTANLIMERNICEDGTVAKEEKKCTVEWYASATDNSYGPVTAMNYLNNATSTWSNIPNLKLIYIDRGGNFTNFKVEGKARLPYGDELNYNYDENNLWVYNYLADGGYQSNIITGVYGYWTMDSPTISSSNACYMFYEGSQICNSLVNKLFYGVRPVINVKL